MPIPGAGDRSREESVALVRYNGQAMFNILGILMALLITELSRGNGMIVGWESALGALAGIGLVLAAGLPLAPVVRSRLALAHDLDRALRGSDLPDVEARRGALSAEVDRFLRRVGLLRRLYDLFVMAVFAAICFVAGWADFVSDFWGVPAGLEVLPDIAPYLALLIAAWFNHWRAECAIRPGWSFGSFLGVNLRGNLMLLAPVVLVSTAVFALRAASPQFDDAMDAFAFLQSAVQMVMMVGVVVFVPAVVRFILPSRRLPEGALRNRLLAFAKARKVGIREIYVWQTGTRHIATAFVIGLLAPLRYVFLTDALLRQLDEEEVEAVFAHELGHAHYHHLWWLLAFLYTVTIVLLGAATVMGTLPQWLSERGFSESALGASRFLPLAVALAYGYVAFGYVSRRFERQADFYAIEHTRPELLARVFLKLGAASGHSLSKSGWRHFSLEQRIREIALVSARPQARRSFTRELVLGMAASALVTLAALVALRPALVADFTEGRLNYSFAQFERERVDRSGGEALTLWRERVLANAEKVKQLDETRALVARLYTAVTDTLSGRESPEFDALARDVAALRDQSQSVDERERYEQFLEDVEASRRAAERARAKGTRWTAEYREEIGR